MQIAVIAGGIAQNEFQDKQLPDGVMIQFVATIAEAKKEADAYFYLHEEEYLIKDIEQIKNAGVPVFVNAVSTMLKDLPENCIRICGWRGFLLQDTIEISARKENIEPAEKILQKLQWQFQPVPDIVGLIAPRTTAILINEAYLIVNGNAERKQGIDTAIKLAANFSSGPFELAEKIGLQKIFSLLQHLAAEDTRYSPAPFLQKEISDIAPAS